MLRDTTSVDDVRRCVDDKIVELRRKLRRTSIQGIIISALVLFAFLVASGVINEAIVLRRVFFANLAICGPFLSETDEKAFRARFAGMKGRNDYLAIRRDLTAFARANHVELLGGEVW